MNRKTIIIAVAAAVLALVIVFSMLGVNHKQPAQNGYEGNITRNRATVVTNGATFRIEPNEEHAQTRVRLFDSRWNGEDLPGGIFFGFFYSLDSEPAWQPGGTTVPPTPTLEPGLNQPELNHIHGAITIPLQRNGISDEVAQGFQVAYEKDGAWISIPSTVNLENETVTASVRHASWFSLLLRNPFNRPPLVSATVQPNVIITPLEEQNLGTLTLDVQAHDPEHVPVTVDVSYELITLEALDTAIMDVYHEKYANTIVVTAAAYDLIGGTDLASGFAQKFHDNLGQGFGTGTIGVTVTPEESFTQDGEYHFTFSIPLNQVSLTSPVVEVLITVTVMDDLTRNPVETTLSIPVQERMPVPPVAETPAPSSLTVCPPQPTFSWTWPGTGGDNQDYDSFAFFLDRGADLWQNGKRWSCWNSWGTGNYHCDREGIDFNSTSWTPEDPLKDGTYSWGLAFSSRWFNEDFLPSDLSIARTNVYHFRVDSSLTGNECRLMSSSPAPHPEFRGAIDDFQTALQTAIEGVTSKNAGTLGLLMDAQDAKDTVALLGSDQITCKGYLHTPTTLTNEYYRLGFVNSLAQTRSLAWYGFDLYKDPIDGFYTLSRDYIPIVNINPFSGRDALSCSGDGTIIRPCIYWYDCESKFCNPNGLCAIPSCSDGWQNGDEGGVDCGGSCAPCASVVVPSPTDTPHVVFPPPTSIPTGLTPEEKANEGTHNYTVVKWVPEGPTPPCTWTDKTGFQQPVTVTFGSGNVRMEFPYQGLDEHMDRFKLNSYQGISNWRSEVKFLLTGFRLSLTSTLNDGTTCTESTEWRFTSTLPPSPTPTHTPVGPTTGVLTILSPAPGSTFTITDFPGGWPDNWELDVVVNVPGIDMSSSWESNYAVYVLWEGHACWDEVRSGPHLGETFYDWGIAPPASQSGEGRSIRVWISCPGTYEILLKYFHTNGDVFVGQTQVRLVGTSDNIVPCCSDIPNVCNQPLP